MKRSDLIGNHVRSGGFVMQHFCRVEVQGHSKVIKTRLNALCTCQFLVEYEPVTIILSSLFLPSSFISVILFVYYHASLLHDPILTSAVSLPPKLVLTQS